MAHETKLVTWTFLPHCFSQSLYIKASRAGRPLYNTVQLWLLAVLGFIYLL